MKRNWTGFEGLRRTCGNHALLDAIGWSKTVPQVPLSIDLRELYYWR